MEARGLNWTTISKEAGYAPYTLQQCLSPSFVDNGRYNFQVLARCLRLVGLKPSRPLNEYK